MLFFSLSFAVAVVFVVFICAMYILPIHKECGNFCEFIPDSKLPSAQIRRATAAMMHVSCINPFFVYKSPSWKKNYHLPKYISVDELCVYSHLTQSHNHTTIPIHWSTAAVVVGVVGNGSQSAHFQFSFWLDLGKIHLNAWPNKPTNRCPFVNNSNVRNTQIG